MSATSLAVVVGPNFQAKTDQFDFEVTGKLNQLIEKLIENYNTLFEDDVVSQKKVVQNKKENELLDSTDELFDLKERIDKLIKMTPQKTNLKDYEK